MSPGTVPPHEATGEHEEVWREAGWGPRLAWPVPDPAADLLFSLRLPDGWTAEDLVVPDSAFEDSAAADDHAAAAESALRSWQTMPGSITAQRLCRLLPRPGGPGMPLLATLTATHAELQEPPDLSPGGEHAAPVRLGPMTGWAFTATRAVRRAGAAPLSVLVVRYLLATEYGSLAVSFSSPQRPFHDVLAKLFGDVAQTLRLEPAG